jgi:hypothetical protein
VVNHFYLGRTATATGTPYDHFDGVIDDVRIYSRAVTNVESYRLAAGRSAGSAPTIHWSKKSGPGRVRFSDPNITNPTATIIVPGEYVLEATASDGELIASDCLYASVPMPIGGKLSDLYLRKIGPPTTLGSPRTLASSGEDSDGDGQSNFAEYLHAH